MTILERTIEEGTKEREQEQIVCRGILKEKAGVTKEFEDEIEGYQQEVVRLIKLIGSRIGDLNEQHSGDREKGLTALQWYNCQIGVPFEKDKAEAAKQQGTEASSVVHPSATHAMAMLTSMGVRWWHFGDKDEEDRTTREQLIAAAEQSIDVGYAKGRKLRSSLGDLLSEIAARV